MSAYPWSQGPFGLIHSSGECRIVKATGEGWKLLWGGEHVATFRLLRDAKRAGHETALSGVLSVGGGSGDVSVVWTLGGA